MFQQELEKMIERHKTEIQELMKKYKVTSHLQEGYLEQDIGKGCSQFIILTEREIAILNE